ncbi:MAG: rhodanese-like domain-containing protein [Verrucomicrobia bacterium]|nr:rhodanese-like domain-containing protein [Verrucomicrobiota bacterium]
MTALAQLSAVLALAAAAAGATYWIKGPPSRAVPCDAAALPPDEVCLERVLREWQGQVLWVDARSRAEWERNGMAGALLWNLDENQQAFEAEAAGRMIDGPRVLVYCSNENCDTSRQVAEQIRTLQLSNGVFVLHGGWRALAAAKLTKDFQRQ